jgi:hypothetical protein
MKPNADPSWTRWLAAWLLVTLLYLWLGKTPVSRAYLDFGDGNYQYISWRMTQGVHLYTDILSPQPPFHLWTGYCLHQLADSLGLDPLVAFRWCIHLFRAWTSLAVFGISFLLFRSGPAAWLASALFYFLPEGYRWSQTYQSEHLELLFLTLSWLGCLARNRGLKVCAAPLAVCAVWTNMSSLPFAVLLLLLSTTAPPRSFLPFGSALGALLILLAISLGLAGSSYFENVWSNQVASIPANPAVWMGSIAEHGTTIVVLEGLFILLALFGLYRFLQRPSREPWSRALITLYGVASIGSAVYVVKGGTVDYIFLLAEPVLAVFGAWAWLEFMGPARSPVKPAAPSNAGVEEVAVEGGSMPSAAGVAAAFCRVLLLAGLVVLLGWQPFRFIAGFRAQAGVGVDLADVSVGRIVEFSDVEVRTLERLLSELSNPGDTIWAPPYFAALSKRKIMMDLSETYLWWVRWQQSAMTGKPDSGVNRMIEGMASQIEAQEIPLLLINDRTGQWGMLLVPGRELQGIPIRQMDPRIERLQHALEEHYQPILAHPGSEEKLYFQGWNERLEVWVPKGQPAYLPPWVTEGFGGVMQSSPGRTAHQ